MSRRRRATAGTVLLQTAAPAKINWTLEVLGRRGDGFHEIRSVLQTVSLADTLALRAASSLCLLVDGVEASPVELTENLISRAARLFPERLARDPMRFDLTKQIPAAAGLGGGSSDAAAALRLASTYWHLDDAEALHRAAAVLGSDVPFFLRGGAQLAAGRGDVLTPLPDPPPVSVLLTVPPLTVPNKTARLYAQLTPAHYSDGGATARLVDRIEHGFAPTADDYMNAFDAVADQVYPWLAEHRRALASVTGARVMLAGAGPSLFSVVGAADAEQHAAARAALLRQRIRSVVVRSCGGHAHDQLG